jgi:hypothetical protein
MATVLSSFFSIMAVAAIVSGLIFGNPMYLSMFGAPLFTVIVWKSTT